jgi:hypothetical protein
MGATRAPDRSIGWLGAILAAAAVVCGGCSLPWSSPPVYVPETAGLVVAYDASGQDYDFVLDGGRDFTAPVDGTWIRGPLKEGAVLLAGSQPVPWAYLAGLNGPPDLVTPACYVIHGPATMDATHVYQTVNDPLGDIVIALPKAADWTGLGQEPGSDHLIGGGTCINPQGQAFDRVWGPG